MTAELEQFYIDAELYADAEHLSRLPRAIGAFPTREAAELWLDARRPLWGEYSIGPLYRPREGTSQWPF